MLLVVFVWSQTVYSYVAAAVTDRDARSVQAAGQFDEAERRFRQAIDLAPDAPAHRINLGQLFFARGTQATEARENKVNWLQRATVLVEGIIDRNPLDQRAWSRLSEYERELAVLVPTVQAQALHSNLLLVELMPGFWQARTGLAWAYIRLGRHEDALRVVQEAKDVRVLESSGANLIYYIQAWALEGLGRIEEAKAAAHCSLAYQVTQQAIDLLERNGETVGDKYDFTEADYEVCPEKRPV